MKAYIYWIHLPEHQTYSDGYIGVARNPKVRFRDHKNVSKKEKHHNPRLQKAFKKHKDQIVQHIIWMGEEDNCYKIENELRPRFNIGWNKAPGGTHGPGMNGKKHTQESKDKVSKTKKGNPIGPNKKKKILSIEHKQNISKSRKGIPKTAEHNRKTGDARRGRKAFHRADGTYYYLIENA